MARWVLIFGDLFFFFTLYRNSAHFLAHVLRKSLGQIVVYNKNGSKIIES